MQPITKEDIERLKKQNVALDLLPVHVIPDAAPRPPEPEPEPPLPAPAVLASLPATAAPAPSRLIYHPPRPLPAFYRALLPLAACSGALFFTRLVYVHSTGLSALGASMTSINKCYDVAVIGPATLFTTGLHRVGDWSGSRTPYIHLNPALGFVGMAVFSLGFALGLCCVTVLPLLVLFRLACRIAGVNKPLDSAWPKFLRANIVGVLTAPLVAGGLTLSGVELVRFWTWLFAHA